MTQASPSIARTLVNRYYQAMIAKNADDFAALYALDAVHEFPFLSPYFPQRLSGREAIRSHYQAVWTAAPMQIQNIRETAFYGTSAPDLFIAEAEYTALSSNGDKFALSFLIVMRLADGLIVHLRDYMDALGTACAVERLPQMIKALETRQRVETKSRESQ